jgi:GNAT superfamily N-acetyltransferase
VFSDHFIIDGKPFKYAWLSTLFISNEFRGKRIAQTLLNTAFEEYEGNIAITEFTKEAESLYNKIGLFPFSLKEERDIISKQILQRSFLQKAWFKIFSADF